MNDTENLSEIPVLQRRRLRRRVRELARSSYFETGRNQDEAIKLVREDIHAEMNSIIGAILVGVLIKLAVDLIVYWIQSAIDFPPVTYQAGEPGYDHNETL